MRVQATASNPVIATRMTAPSPLVGEGIPIGRPGCDRVRGTASGVVMRSLPLTRLRFAKPPSPTRGEGKRAATFPRATA
jgi:hypothetical protein